MSIGGTIVVHDAQRLDYCVKEAVESLLACCDEVVIVEAGSTDNTYLWLRDWFGPKLRIERAGWGPVPGTHGAWLCDLFNLARSFLMSGYHFSLQADEVAADDTRGKLLELAKIGKPALCRRFNFWKDARHIAPVDRVCGANIIRFAPTVNPFIGDAENLSGNPIQSEINIFHYGFLRRQDALITKCIEQEDNFFRGHNPLFDQMKTEGRKPFDDYLGDLPPFDGQHPARMIPWLQARGYA
jgi:hypothetical protein